jgi:ABC-type Zn uptake system ZnuABC Zn-binding protein ZnuA
VRTVLSFSSVGAVALALLGCAHDSGDGARASVVATTPQVADFARQVGGDRVEVTQILPANADPHEYEPRPSDAEALANADLIVRSGGDVDGWLDQLVESSGSDAPVLDLIDHVRTREGADGDVDPHWWHDPRNAELAVGALRDELISVDPESRSAYRRNAAAYERDLDGLDRAIASCIRAVPADERKLVTSHDSLGYYAARYGIDVIGATIPSLSTQAEPSAGDTAELVDLIRSSGVSTIFPEAGVSRELEEAIATQADARVGGQLWADTLGPADSDGATYVEAELSNTVELVSGFTDRRQGCQVSLPADR